VGNFIYNLSKRQSSPIVLNMFTMVLRSNQDDMRRQLGRSKNVTRTILSYGGGTGSQQQRCEKVVVNAFMPRTNCVLTLVLFLSHDNDDCFEHVQNNRRRLPFCQDLPVPLTLYTVLVVN
jgi:hypothetical protein